jgi:hypothetical protein
MIEFAEVRNIKDPLFSGRVQLRIYGKHDDEKAVKDDHLPWSLPLMPPQSASTGKVGHPPTGLQIGSRVAITYAANDKQKQYPIILGSFYRGAQPQKADSSSGPSTSSDTASGTDKLDKESYGHDTGHTGESSDPGKYKNKTNHNTALGQKPFDSNKDKYNAAQIVKNGSGVEGIKTAMEKFAPNASMPTTAAGDPATKQLPELLKKIDPKALSQVLPAMYSQFAKMRDMINFAGGSGGGTTGKPTKPTPATKEMMIKGLTGAICILGNKYGFAYIFNMFLDTIGGTSLSKVSDIPQDFVDIIKQSLIDARKLYEQHGQQIPVSETPVVLYRTNAPVPLPIYGFPPDLYTQVYYPPESDPYPGFISWKGPNGDFIYTVRSASHPPYSSVTEQIFDQSQKGLAKDLEPYIVNKTLTARVIYDLLEKYFDKNKNTAMEAAMGANGSDVMKFLQQLVGPIMAQAINKAKENHLPKSVLDQGKMEETLKKKAKKQAVAKKAKKDAKKAVDPNASLEQDETGGGALNTDKQPPAGNPQDETGGGALDTTGQNTPVNTAGETPAQISAAAEGPTNAAAGNAENLNASDPWVQASNPII